MGIGILAGGGVHFLSDLERPIMTAQWITADVFDGLATLEDGSVDLVVTSPPFLALRSYLPADHPDKGKEIGSEATPAEFIDVMLKVTAELRRVLAPHGSICVELGDTYAGSGGAGGDYNENGLRDGQPPFAGSVEALYRYTITNQNKGVGWPLAKSRTLIPQLYEIALAYGINPLTGASSPAGQWRIRNVVTWARPNPPVGALGDKWRPATSDLIVACTSPKRYWDDLATRKPISENSHGGGTWTTQGGEIASRGEIPKTLGHASGAPLLDYWEIPPGGYRGQVATEWQRPVDRRESVGDIRRTTSADCPEHGDQTDQASTGPHGEPESAVQSPHNPDTGNRPVQGQLGDSAPTDATLDHSDSFPSPTSESSARSSGSTATSRSKAGNRTGLAPGTNPADTPSEEMTLHTDGKPTTPESDVHRPDTDESRTSSDGSPASRPRTPGRTLDTDTPDACTCSYYVLETKYTSHYAVFPEELVVPCVKAMCPEKVCRVCGEPSRRIVEKTRLVNGSPTVEAPRRPGRVGHAWDLEADVDPETDALGYGRTYGLEVETLGWSDCGHDDYRPGLILDPFAGSGTTLSVATGHGHDAIGIDLDERNADLARERIGPFLFEETRML